MTINWMPEHFNQRRPKTSYLLGQAIGEGLGKASDMYLKGKMDNYFQSQKDERDAKIEQAARERAGSALAELEGQPDRGRIYKNLTPSMLQERAKAINETLLNSAGSSVASAFARSGQGQPTSKIPGVSPERQAETEKTKNYQAESEMLNPNAGREGQPTPGQESQQPPQPQSIQDQILQKHNNRVAELNSIRNDLYQNPNANSNQIEANFKNEMARAQQQFDNDMKTAGPQIERENKAVVSHDESIQKDYEKTKDKADISKNLIGLLEKMDEIVDEGYVGPFGGIKAVAGMEFEKRIKAEETLNNLGMAMMELHSLAQGRGISQNEFPSYKELIPKVTDTVAGAKAKINAYKAQLEYSIKKYDVYEAIRKPDGTLPKDSFQKVDKLMKEGKKAADKMVKEAVGEKESKDNFKEGQKFSSLPSNARKGDRFNSKSGQILEFDGSNYKLVG